MDNISLKEIPNNIGVNILNGIKQKRNFMNSEYIPFIEEISLLSKNLIELLGSVTLYKQQCDIIVDFSKTLFEFEGKLRELVFSYSGHIKTPEDRKYNFNNFNDLSSKIIDVMNVFFEENKDYRLSLKSEEVIYKLKELRNRFLLYQ